MENTKIIVFGKITKKILQNKKEIIVFLLVFIFTFILRAHNYEKTPGAGHLDEQLYAWSGMYLVEEGIPVSWSTLDYPKSAQVFKGEKNYKGDAPKASVTLYRPWLDEPPLFSYLVGYFAHKFGALRTDWVPSSFIRFPIIFISSLVSIFVFLIARKISGFWIGILSMFLYGTIPIFVFASRTAMPESLIALFFVVSVYLIMLYEKTKSFWLMLPLPVLAGLAGLSKPTGYFIILLDIFFVVWTLYPLIKKQKSREIKKILYPVLYLILGIIPFIWFYFWWGNHWDLDIFKTISSIQSARPAGFGSLAWFFITPSYDTIITRDSFFVFGLLSSIYFLLARKSRSEYFVLISFAFWVMVVMVSGGENDLLAWYRFPAYPMLAIITAWGLKLLVKKADFFASFFIFGMLLGNRMLLVTPLLKNISAVKYRIIFSVLMFFPTLNLIIISNKLKVLTRIIMISAIAVGLYFNVKYVYSAYELACENTTCPMVPTTFLSTLRLPFLWRFFVVKN